MPDDMRAKYTKPMTETARAKYETEIDELKRRNSVAASGADGSA